MSGTRGGYLGIVGRPLIVLAAVGGLLGWNLRRRVEPAPAAPAAVEAPTVVERAEVVPAARRPMPSLDGAVVRSALEELARARDARAAAEAALAAGAARIEAATRDRTEIREQVSGLEGEAAILGSRAERALRDRAAAEAELKGLKAELATLAAAPARKRAKPLVERNPVARPPGGEEYHFEVRGDRVAYINLNALLERLKVDARIQLRMMTVPKPIEGEVGPVGWFSLRYQMLPAGLELGGGSFSGRGAVQASFALSRWEVVPTQNLRGETLAEALSPASDFARAVNTLDPRSDAITIWVYPDGFAMYRQVRDWLHQRGFLVAARPLPAEMPIRGSPSGSVSAGQ